MASRNYIKPKLTKHGGLGNVTFSKENEPSPKERAKWKAEINRIKSLDG